MTLHVGYITREFVMQVGDRLVTQTIDRGSGEDPEVIVYDAHASKQLLLIFPGTFLILAWAGAAYIDRTSTDYWIAEQLRGKKTDLGLHGFPEWQVGVGADEPLKYGECISRLLKAIEDRWGSQPREYRKHGLQILGTGFRTKREWVQKGLPARPFSFKILARTGRAPFITGDSPRTWAWHSTSHVLWAPRRSDLDGYFSQMCDYLSGDTNKTDADTEAILSSAIRAISKSKRGKRIGSELMASTISFDGDVRIRYLRNTSRLDDPYVVFTPHIIGPGAYFPTMRHEGSGPNSFSVGSIPITYEVVPPLPTPSMSMSHGYLPPPPP